MQTVEVLTAADARKNRDELARMLLEALEERRTNSELALAPQKASAAYLDELRMAYDHATDLLNRLEAEEREEVAAKHLRSQHELAVTQTKVATSVKSATWVLVAATLVTAVAAGIQTWLAIRGDDTRERYAALQAVSTELTRDREAWMRIASERAEQCERLARDLGAAQAQLSAKKSSSK